MNDDERAAKNRILAGVMGFHVGHLKSGYWTLYGNDNSPRGNFLSEKEAWEHTRDFYGSLDASAATLPADALIFLNVMPDGENEANIGGDAYNGFTAYKGTGSTRAEALANAVLAWATATKGGAA